jgi:hypothetical protein
MLAHPTLPRPNRQATDQRTADQRTGDSDARSMVGRDVHRQLPIQPGGIIIGT